MSLDDTQTLRLEDTGGLPWPVPATDDSPWETWLKRSLDVIVAAALLVATAPLLGLVVVAIKLTSRGPALFRQTRIGHRCHRFEMFKLRTMEVGAAEREAELAESLETTFFKMADDPRVTRLGRFLRRTSLDELPQLVNVLRGDMSLVGPRPLLPRDFARYPKHAQMRRFSRLPGVTGLWQVSGRSDTTDRERIDLDLRYVDEWSLGLDLEILLRTVPAVLSGRGAT